MQTVTMTRSESALYAERDDAGEAYRHLMLRYLTARADLERETVELRDHEGRALVEVHPTGSR